MTSGSGVAKGGPTAVSRVAAEERELPRQGSLVDGEGIKIVIHDFDCDIGERILLLKYLQTPRVYVNLRSLLTPFFIHLLYCPTPVKEIVPVKGAQS